MQLTTQHLKSPKYKIVLEKIIIPDIPKDI